MGNPEENKEREGFADAIDRAAFGNERVLLRRRGRAVAAVVPIDDLRLLEALEDRLDLVDARAALARANKKGVQSLDVMLKEWCAHCTKQSRQFSWPFLLSSNSTHSPNRFGSFL